jgi:hypothetical protein
MVTTKENLQATDAAACLSASEFIQTISWLLKDGFDLQASTGMLRDCLTFLTYIGTTGGHMVMAAEEFDPAWHALIAMPWYDDFVSRFSEQPIVHIEYGVEQMREAGRKEPQEVMGLARELGLSSRVNGSFARLISEALPGGMISIKGASAFRATYCGNST